MARVVLHIDDQADLPTGFEPELSQLGFELVQTDDPDEALRAVRGDGVDLVLLEALLERFDGFELLDEIRACDAELPVVIVTRGERTPDLYARALESGACDFLTKPVLRGQLLTTVRDFARKREAPAAARASASAGEGFSVDLAACPVAELLCRLHREGASGTCIAMRGDEQRGIQLRNGSPVAVSSNRPAESFEDFLGRSGWLTQKQHDELVAQLGVGMGSVEEIVLGLGVLSEAEIAAAQRERTEEQLFAAFTWESGRARFLPGKRLKAGTAIEIEVPPAELLLRGALRASTPEQIHDALDARRSLYASALGAGAPAPSEPEAEELLASLDGDRTVADLLEADAANARLLYALWISGLAELCTDPVLVLEDALGGAEEGGAEEADAEADVAATAEQKAKEAADRSLEAENWFRKGRLCLREKAYAKAVEAFGMASHLDPGQGDYAAHLGYSLYLSNPNQTVVRREAMEHIAKGIKLSPDREMPYVYLARVFRETGDAESARKVLRRAAKMHPESLEVQRERRLLSETSPPAKAGGFFSRFKKR